MAKTKAPKVNKAYNLILNLSAGLLPENLTKEEVGLLKKKFGKNWFTDLGYNEKDYRKPK